MPNKEEHIDNLKHFIDSFAKVCYIMGKTEGLQGNQEDNSRGLEIPNEILGQILTEIIEDVIETNEKPKEMGFAPNIEFKEPPKIIITKEKEAELIKKYGKKQMEKLAKELNFHGELLNIK